MTYECMRAMEFRGVLGADQDLHSLRVGVYWVSDIVYCIHTGQDLVTRSAFTVQ